MRNWTKDELDIIDDYTDSRYSEHVEEDGEPSNPIVLRAELRDEVIREMTDIRAKTDLLIAAVHKEVLTLNAPINVDLLPFRGLVTYAFKDTGKVSVCAFYNTYILYNGNLPNEVGDLDFIVEKLREFVAARS